MLRCHPTSCSHLRYGTGGLIEGASTRFDLREPEIAQTRLVIFVYQDVGLRDGTVVNLLIQMESILGTLTAFRSPWTTPF